ncbi:hypothetical protein E4T39_03178 [Aureobasidium subglaciale]|nr:hypothetical protein E4T39_03178 [Aureobasidium subglaciale]
MQPLKSAGDPYKFPPPVIPPVASTTVWPSTAGQEYVACDMTAGVADKVVLADEEPKLDCCGEELDIRLGEMPEEELEATLDTELTEKTRLTDELDTRLDEEIELGNKELEREESAGEGLDATLDREFAEDDPILIDELDLIVSLEDVTLVEEGPMVVDEDNELERAEDALEDILDEELEAIADEELEIEDKTDEELKARLDEGLELDDKVLEREERADEELDATLDVELDEDGPVPVDELDVGGTLNELETDDDKADEELEATLDNELAEDTTLESELIEEDATLDNELAEEEPMLVDDVDTTLEDTLDPEERADEMDDRADEILEETLDAELDRELTEGVAMLVDVESTRLVELVKLVELTPALEVELEELLAGELVDDARELDKLMLTADDELVVINKELDEELVVVVVKVVVLVRVEGQEITLVELEAYIGAR